MNRDLDLNIIPNPTSSPLIRSIVKHYYKKDLFGSGPILLHCVESFNSTEDITIPKFLLYRACLEYNIFPIDSLYYSQDNQEATEKIIESIKSWTDLNTISVITNNYDLIKNNMFLHVSLMHLAKEKLIKLYQVEQEILLIKVKA